MDRYFPGLKDALDSDFIKFLSKGFDLRCASVDGPGYNIVINQHRTLLALDQTMVTVDFVIALGVNGMPHPTPLRRAIELRDSLVYLDNVALKTISFEELAQRNNKMFELRVSKHLETLAITYETEGLNIVGSFCKPTDMDFNKFEFFLARG